MAMRGFTLVETLIAVSLIAIAFSAFVDLLVKNIQASVITQESFTATTLALDALEIIKNKKDNHVACVDTAPPCAVLSGNWQHNLVGGPYEVNPIEPNRQLTTGHFKAANLASLDPICVVSAPAQDVGKFAHCSTTAGDALRGNFTRAVTISALDTRAIDVEVVVTWNNGSFTIHKVLFDTY